MSTIMRTLVTSLLLFMLPILVFQAYKILVVGSCDPKFGCWGTFKLTLLIASTYCFVSLVALMAIQLFSKVNMINVHSVLVTLLLGIAHRFVFSVELLDSLTKQVLFWLVLSGLLYSLAALISKNITSTGNRRVPRSCFER